uniref:Uncharacterized protein n=1 Tax=Phage sp. ct4bw6 TaxID=2826747 RepID=A0A8S5MUU4_9VIRU|nr:MAG TPA: hypothetical protein [Phage sp. ct4bw6]
MESRPARRQGRLQSPWDDYPGVFCCLGHLSNIL